MHKNPIINLVEEFRHSVPYINAHRGKIFVILLSGEAIKHKNFIHIINDIGLLHSLGIRLVVVYDATPQIKKRLISNNIDFFYHKDILVTNAEVLKLIKEEIGKLQLDITALLSMSLTNTPSQGANINVVSGNFVISQPLGVDNGVDYCHTGRVRKINKEYIKSQLENRSIVLIGPISVSITGESFNLISEEIAAEISVKLKAEKVIGFSSSQGIINKNGKFFSELFPSEVKKMISIKRKCSFSASIIRFLKSSIKSCTEGVRRCHLISYKKNGSLLQELFSRDGIGTQIVMESSEKIRKATINDIGGILKLIRPLEEKKILVRRSREQLEVEIDKFTVIVRDELTIACAALYPFQDEKIGEMACVVVHPDYRKSSRGEKLLQIIQKEAKKLDLKKIFVLTTYSIHWFQEKGFLLADINSLPESKKKMYNYQRGSKVLELNIF
ncbi:amino-acid N-acetyltransferase [Buchnera aphidicola (Mindarus keteleerifoliae)]|uniref:amino-acid N-acetyltransferase n=1 Tax=Buchnera aphidicola TaxID=9 RepID=UPI0031B6EE72